MPDTDSTKNQIESFYENFHSQKAKGPVRIMLKSRFRVLKKLLRKTTGRILIVGCGSQGEMNIIPPIAQGYGIDISTKAVEAAKKEFPYYKIRTADAAHLPFEDSFFTAVVCSEVIEHVDDADAVIAEIARTTAPQGKLLLTTPNWYSWYGLFRLVGEKIFQKPLTSDDQPIDHWSTPQLMEKKLHKRFNIIQQSGFWYYPPFGKGNVQLPSLLTVPFVVLLWPVEALCRIIFPLFGHSMVFVCRKK